MNGSELLEGLRRLCGELDRGLAPTRIVLRRVVVPVAVPVVVGLSLGLGGGCVVDERDVEEGCSDGEDNDGDGDADCVDSDCYEAPACLAQPTYGAAFEEVCDDGFDDDGDGRIDCSDSDCDYDAHCDDDVVVAEYMAPFPSS